MARIIPPKLPPVGLAGMAVKSSVSRLAGLFNRLLDTPDFAVQFSSGAEHRRMLNPPYRLQRGRIVRRARDDVPVDVGNLIAEQFVIDLRSPIGLCERF